LEREPLMSNAVSSSVSTRPLKPTRADISVPPAFPDINACPRDPLSPAVASSSMLMSAFPVNDRSRPRAASTLFGPAIRLINPTIPVPSSAFKFSLILPLGRSSRLPMRPALWIAAPRNRFAFSFSIESAPPCILTWASTPFALRFSPNPLPSSKPACRLKSRSWLENATSCLPCVRA